MRLFAQTAWLPVPESTLEKGEQAAVLVAGAVGLADAAPPAWLPLTDDDRARLAAFRVHDDARRFLTGRMLVFQHVRDVLHLSPSEVRFVRGFTEAGEWKPVLVAADPDVTLPAVSVSHSRDIVVAAFCESHEVGVDVEAHAAFEGAADPVLSHALTVAERRTLSDRAEAARAFTAKEAVLKAMGFGFAIDPLSVEIVSDRVRWTATTRSCPVSVVEVPMLSAGVSASVALTDLSPDVQILPSAPYRPFRPCPGVKS